MILFNVLQQPNKAVFFPYAVDTLKVYATWKVT
jgi:hypothetical protein